MSTQAGAAARYTQPQHIPTVNRARFPPPKRWSQARPFPRTQAGLSSPLALLRVRLRLLVSSAWVAPASGQAPIFVHCRPIGQDLRRKVASAAKSKRCSGTLVARRPIGQGTSPKLARPPRQPRSLRVFGQCRPPGKPSPQGGFGGRRKAVLRIFI